jgi:hypothetical protein
MPGKERPVKAVELSTETYGLRGESRENIFSHGYPSRFQGEPLHRGERKHLFGPDARSLRRVLTRKFSTRVAPSNPDGLPYPGWPARFPFQHGGEALAALMRGDGQEGRGSGKAVRK